MTKIADLKGSKAVPQSTSLGSMMPDTIPDNEIMQWINDVNMEWGKHIFPRMDEDEKLWTLDPYVLRDAKNNVLDDVISVTLNDARVFGERVLSVLNESEELIEVNGQRNGKPLDGHQTSVIEDFWRDLIYLSNEHLNDILMPDLDTYLWEQIGVRGAGVVRILLSQDGDNFDADIMPIDRRKFVYTVGQFGLARVAHWDTIDKDMCRFMYPEHTPMGNMVTRWDYWDWEKEMIFLDGKLYDSQPNPLGHPPYVIQLCQQGTFLDTSSRALRMKGESIFSANRELYPELNRIASIMQTQNMLTLAPPNVMISKSGKKTPKEPLYRLGRTTALEVGEGVVKLDAPDIQASTRFFQALLNSALQRGSISHIDWGNLQFQLSQVAIATLAGASRQVFTPRLKTMERLKRMMARETISQFTRFDMRANIGRIGKQATYTKADLEGDYRMDFEYLTALPEETAAAYGLANMAQRWMDDKSIRKTILKYRDYDDIDEKYLVQQAQRISKALALFTQAQALDRQDRKDEAKLLLIEMGQTLEAGVNKEVLNLSGNGASASPEAKQVASGFLAGSPSPERMRTTRKTEPPGQGEVEEVPEGEA